MTNLTSFIFCQGRIGRTGLEGLPGDQVCKYHKKTHVSYIFFVCERIKCLDPDD